MEPKVKDRPSSKSNDKVKEPEKYRVILLNDHFTTMEFVVAVLMEIFHKSGADANRIMMDVHKKGKGIVGVYPWDIAATKAEQVHSVAKAHEYPLRCVVEPE